MARLRLVVITLCAVLAGVLLFAFSHTRSIAAGEGPCGEVTFSDNGVAYRVLFAKNGAVQQYLLQQSSNNVERDHDVLKEAITKYGPEAVNAPPLRIITFRPGGGGMMVPDKAVDSCGRITHFH